MKLQHYIPKINTGFGKSSGSRYSQNLRHPRNFAATSGESDLIGCGQIPSNNQYLYSASADAKIKLYDRLGRQSIHSLKSGNICVINDNPEECKEFSEFLADSVYQSGLVARIVDAKKFFKHVRSGIDPDIHYIIQGNSHTFLSVIAEIYRINTAICIFRNKGCKLVCSLRGHAQLDAKIGRIIRALGGNYTLRGLMLATLEAGEFLLINEGKETIRLFKNQQPIEGGK